VVTIHRIQHQTNSGLTGDKWNSNLLRAHKVTQVDRNLNNQILEREIFQARILIEKAVRGMLPKTDVE